MTLAANVEDLHLPYPLTHLYFVYVIFLFDLQHVVWPLHLVKMANQENIPQSTLSTLILTAVSKANIAAIDTANTLTPGFRNAHPLTVRLSTKTCNFSCINNKIPKCNSSMTPAGAMSASQPLPCVIPDE